MQMNSYENQPHISKIHTPKIGGFFCYIVHLLMKHVCVCSVRSKFVLLLMDRYSHTYIQLTVLVFIHILNHVLTLPNYLSVCVYIHAASPSAPHQRGLDEEESEERGHERHESWTTASHHK